MKLSRRANDSFGHFVRRTVAAQIHGLSCLAVLLGLCFLLPMARAFGPAHFWASLVFGISGMLVFGASAAFHFCNDGCELSPRLASFLEQLDHYAIYGVIAGSYTPF